MSVSALCWLTATALLLFAGAKSFAQDIPWHSAGWNYRALVAVDPKGTTGVDVAWVRILHAGLAAPTGNDFRIFDASGQPVPYQITHHDPARESLISFRCPPGQTNFAIYFGKADAPVDRMRAITPAFDQVGAGEPKPGPGAGGWVPKAGLVLSTLRRPLPPKQDLDDVANYKDDNPNTPAEMAAMIKNNRGIDGAGYRGNISDGYNPFGDTDYFISVYRGWLRIPRAGKYNFCIATNEAGFSFLDGKELVHWPGRHTEVRGRYGERNALVEVAEGMHYVELYHEQVTLYTTAFLGWKPPGAAHYAGLPGDCFPQPHPARVELYQAGGKQTFMPRIVLIDSAWPVKRKTGQYTRYSFQADGGLRADMKGWNFRWTFGDGSSIESENISHVYFELKPYDVKLTATAPDGTRHERTWRIDAFLIDHVAGNFASGSSAVYAPIVKMYDRATLATPALVGSARFFDEVNDRESARDAAKMAVARNDIASDDLADMHLLVATSSALGKSGVSGFSKDPAAARAIVEHLRGAMNAEKDPVKRVQIAERFIRAMGIDQSDITTADEIYKQAEKDAKAEGMSRKMRQAFRNATIARGDAYLFARNLDKANSDYRLAEALSDYPIPPQVRASKIGAFPETIEQLLARGRVDDASRVVAKWQDELPSDQIRGAPLFYIGKLERLEGRPAAAIRPLQLAVELAMGAEFEAEARFTLAESYRDLKDNEGYRRTLTSLVKSGLPGEYREKAIAALKALDNPQSPAPEKR